MRFLQVSGLEIPRSGRAEVWAGEPHGPFSIDFAGQGPWLCLHVRKVGA